jgi:hypothetical protein
MSSNIKKNKVSLKISYYLDLFYSDRAEKNLAK